MASSSASGVRRLVHFLLIGGAAFALGRGFAPSQQEALQPVTIDRTTVERVAGRFEADLGRAPERSELERMLGREIRDELLLREARRRGLAQIDRSIRARLVQNMRFLHAVPELQDTRPDEELVDEALALGLDRDDVVVRRLLIQKVEWLAGDEAAAEPIGEGELLDFLARHQDRFTQPAQISMIHVFRRRDADGATARTALDSALADDGLAPQRAIALGDPFPLGHTFRSKAPQQLAKVFGPDLVSALDECTPKTWCGPLASPFGEHFVWVSEHRPAAPAPLEAVRSQVRKALEQERRETRIAELVASLRSEIPVHIEWPG